MDNQDHETSGSFVKVAMEHLIRAHLNDALGQLRRAPEEPLRLFLAARSVHLALVTALTAALSGSDGIGALDVDSRQEWIAFYEQGSFASGQAPPKYMAPYKELLRRARYEPAGNISCPVVVSDEGEAELAVLTRLRDLTEHPTPDWELIEPEMIKAALLVGVSLTETITQTVAYRYEPEEEAALRADLLELYGLLEGC